MVHFLIPCTLVVAAQEASAAQTAEISRLMARLSEQEQTCADLQTRLEGERGHDSSFAKLTCLCLL